MENLLLKNKRPDQTELFVNLFEWCNLNCTFCWQDHNNWSGIEIIKEQAWDIVKVINESDKANITINLMGGELFADKIPDETFKDYKELIKIILNNSHEDKNLTLNWVTNLVFKKVERIKDLLAASKDFGIESSLTTSFDFDGRFSKASLKIFNENTDLLSKHIKTISVVLTKKNIVKIIENHDETFKRLYNQGYNFFFDYYSPEKNFKELLPTQNDISDVFTFLAEKYPNTSPVNTWIKNLNNQMSCQSSIVIGPNGIQGKCRSLIPKEIEHKLKSEFIVENNDSMESRFVRENNCLQCEYYQRCGLGCFLQNDFIGHEIETVCSLKKVHSRIDELYR